MTMPRATKLRYRPGRDGRFILGIPARNLTEADIARLDAAQYEAAVASGVYVESEPEKPAKADKSDAKAATDAADKE
jgi:hypothetical protein